jgi:hypothetical protein
MSCILFILMLYARSISSTVPLGSKVKNKLTDQAQFVGGTLDGRLISSKLSFFEISAAVDTPDHPPTQWARNYRRIERPSEDKAQPQAYFIDKSIEEARIAEEIGRCKAQFAAGSK